MPQKSETPRKGGVSRNSFRRSFRDLPNPISIPSQILIAAQCLRPAVFTMVAVIALRGGTGHV